MRRQLATELAPAGVRVVTIITGGIPETIGPDADPAIARDIVDATLVGRAATYEDVGHVAVLAASDKAGMMTAAAPNISAGAILDCWSTPGPSLVSHG
jgi:3-oxoacyl-[acyl-carrier protein] reductase